MGDGIMTLSPYLASIRAKIGHDLLVLPAVAVVVRDAAGRLLLVRDRKSGTWSLPAGAIELGEPPSEAAHRELHEETGLADVRLELIAALGGERFRHTYPNGDQVEYSIFVYRGSASESSILKPKDRNEIAQARFFEREAVPEIGLPYPAEVLWTNSLA